MTKPRGPTWDDSIPPSDGRRNNGGPRQNSGRQPDKVPEVLDDTALADRARKEKPPRYGVPRLVALARTYTEEAMDKIADIMRGAPMRDKDGNLILDANGQQIDKASISEQHAAAVEFLNRGYGRPAQAVTLKAQIEHRDVPVRTVEEVEAHLRANGLQLEQIALLLQDLRRDNAPEIEGDVVASHVEVNPGAQERDE